MPKEKLVTARLGPGQFDITCPLCGEVNHRSMWSLAHMHVEQTMTCSKCDTGLRVPMSR